MISVEPKDMPVAKLHSYLLGAIAPRPIAFASTVDVDGNPNLSPFSFFNVFSANPPILIFSPARRVRNNTTKHTLENVLATKEVVINIVNYDIVQQMSLSSTEYGAGVDEFIKSGLTKVKSDLIKPFRVKESPVQLECKVTEVIALGDGGGAGNLVICEVVKLHIDKTILDENGTIDQEKIDLVARMGGSYYTRANQGFFEIPKPLSSLGIGVDALPEVIRNSTILSGNDLGLLANIAQIPSKDSVKVFIKNNSWLNALSQEDKHLEAHDFLTNNELEDAWKILLS